MKKPTKISLAIVILMGILYFFGLHTPFIVNRVKKQIKSGQSVNQVMDILNSSRKKPDLCCWQIQGTKDYICSDPKSCDFPKDQIKLMVPTKKFDLRFCLWGRVSYITTFM